MRKLWILLLLLVPLGCGPKDDGATGDEGGATSDATAVTGDETFTAEVVTISVPGMT